MPTISQAHPPRPSAPHLQKDARELGAADLDVVRPFQLRPQRGHRTAAPPPRRAPAPITRDRVATSAAGRAGRSMQRRVQVAGRRLPAPPVAAAAGGLPVRSDEQALGLAGSAKSPRDVVGAADAARARRGGSRDRAPLRVTAPAPPRRPPRTPAPVPTATAPGRAAIRTAHDPADRGDGQRRRRRRSGRRLVEIHQLDDPQIVVGAHDRQHARRPRRTRPGPHRPRPGTRRACRRSRRAAGSRPARTCKRERQRHHRLPAREAGEIGDRLDVLAVAPHLQDAGEGAQRHDQVDRHVDQGSVDAARRVPAATTDQREADIGDAAVGHQALDVGLADRRERAQRHRRQGEGDDHLLPLRRPSAPNGPISTRTVEAHRGDLGRTRHERGHRRRGALVDVGRPHVERHRRHLEGEARRRRRRARPARRAAGHVPAGQRSARRVEVERASEAVDQGAAIEQHAGGQRAQDEIFQPGLGRAQAGRGGMAAST